MNKWSVPRLTAIRVLILPNNTSVLVESLKARHVDVLPGAVDHLLGQLRSEYHDPGLLERQVQSDHVAILFVNLLEHLVELDTVLLVWI